MFSLVKSALSHISSETYRKKVDQYFSILGISVSEARWPNRDGRAGRGGGL